MAKYHIYTSFFTISVSKSFYIVCFMILSWFLEKTSHIVSTLYYHLLFVATVFKICWSHVSLAENTITIIYSISWFLQ